MKKLLLLAAIASLTACNDKAYQLEIKPEAIGDGLKDCKFYEVKMFSGPGNRLNVVRCPHSTTTTVFKPSKGSPVVVSVDEIDEATRTAITKAELKKKAEAKLTKEELEALKN